MNTKLVSLFLLMLLCAFFAQNLTTTVTEPAQPGTLEILKDWRALAIIAIIISTILVAIGYAVGIGFAMPDMEAWARTEMTQVFANVIIIIALVATVTFIDVGVRAMTIPSGLACEITENCLNSVANEYIDDYIESARLGARNVIDNNFEASANANRRLGFYCTSIWCAQLGLTTTLVGHYMLDSDRYAIVFEYYTGVLASLNAQKFFINEICFKVGPLLLALGIIGRSFFITRKLGGSLIAISAGIMFFFPAMYIFDWLSLDMTLTGDNVAQGQDNACPPECMRPIPLAYYYNASQGAYVGLNKSSQVYDLFEESDGDKAKEILTGNASKAIGKEGIEIISCQINSSKPWFSDYKVKGGQEICDKSCRELPYPSGSSMCANYSMQLACAAIPEQCKVVRILSTVDPEEEAKCPAECRVVVPLNPDCRKEVNADGSENGKCLQSRFDCRVAKTNDLNWRPSIEKSVKGSEKCNVYPKDCVASLDPYESCVWVMPEFGSCSLLCSGCPEECRFKSESDVSDIPTCKDSDGKYLSACNTCPDTCKVSAASIQAKNPQSPGCDSCPINHRILQGIDVLPANYTSDFGTILCSLTSCPAEYRVSIPISACETCAATDESYTYTPHINADCGDLCKPPDNAPVKKSGDYTKIDKDGLVGREEIKNISKLMIPGYLLPLFNIAVTIVVIRALAGMLGGDIEIPGIGKLF